MKILFYDVVTPAPYTNQTLLETGLGGTEATITRVAHSLKEHHTIYVAQHCRDKQDDKLSDGVHYISLETANTLKPDVVVLLRYYNWLEKVGKQFPNARHYFWMHNMPSKTLYEMRETLDKYQYQVIAVSDFHQREIARRLHGKWYQRLMSPKHKNTIIPVHVIYNPIDDHLEPNETPWDPNQMILASTPYKGLPLTLKLFEQVQEKFPEYKLLIATYSKWDKNIQLPNHVEFIGSLPHHKLIDVVRKSFCVFYPQPMRCETFGLVYAESNAVGTPVLAHDFGAAREVLSDPTQLVNGRDASSVITKLTEWRHQRPNLRPNSEFKLSKIKEHWLSLLS